MKRATTEQQQKFVKAIVDFRENGESKGIFTKAAIKAGYSEKSAKALGSRLMQNEAVLTAILDEVTRRDNPLDPVDGVNEMWLIRGIKRLADGAKSEKVKLDAYHLLGKWWRIKAWDDDKAPPIQPLHDGQRIRERIGYLYEKLGVSGLTSSGTPLLPGAVRLTPAKEPGGVYEADPNSGSVHNGRERNEDVCGGNRVGENIVSSDRHRPPDNGGTPAPEDGVAGEAADIREGDGTKPDG